MTRWPHGICTPASSPGAAGSQKQAGVGCLGCHIPTSPHYRAGTRALPQDHPSPCLRVPAPSPAASPAGPLGGSGTSAPHSHPRMPPQLEPSFPVQALDNSSRSWRGGEPVLQLVTSFTARFLNELITHQPRAGVQLHSPAPATLCGDHGCHHAAQWLREGDAPKARGALIASTTPTAERCSPFLIREPPSPQRCAPPPAHPASPSPAGLLKAPGLD